ncbi:GntR family transcriptional regulator [Streptomyces niveus]
MVQPLVPRSRKGRRVSTADRRSRISAVIRQRINEGTWPPGYTFTWPELVREFQLTAAEGNSILGPSLRELRIHGWIESNPRIGARVAKGAEPWKADIENPEIAHHERVETIIRQRLANGTYASGSQFPALTWIGEEFGISPTTARRAVQDIQGDGFLEVRNNKRYVTALANTSDREALLAVPVRPFKRGCKVTAFNSEKTLAEWSRDPRCVVPLHLLRQRLANLGWPPEKALTQPKKGWGTYL